MEKFTKQIEKIWRRFEPGEPDLSRINILLLKRKKMLNGMTNITSHYALILDSGEIRKSPKSDLLSRCDFKQVTGFLTS
jgi:hypothetical protein